MPSYSEDFTSVADWHLEGCCGAEAGHLVAGGTPPPGQPGGTTTAGQLIEDNTGGSAGYFGVSRLDLVDGGDPVREDWMRYAFYIEDWDQMWMGGAGSGLYFTLPGFSQVNDPDNLVGFLWFPRLRATSATTGIIRPLFNTGDVAVTHQAWHTLRMSLKLDGASSTTNLYLDDTLISTFSADFGVTTGQYGIGMQDDQGNFTSATVWLADMVWSPGADPGEPTSNGGNGGGGGTDCEIQVILDGTDVTDVSIEGSVTRRLNRPALASIKIPMDSAIGGAGSILKIYFDSTLYFHGFVMDCETDSGEDDGYTVYNASDPMELWKWRPARDDTGDFTVPTFITDYVTGPEIMYDILSNSISNGGGGPPVHAEGDLFLNLNAPATDGCNLTGAPVDWPMTIGEVFGLLGSTGCLDVVITPTDPGGGIMGEVDFYNGDYGQDLSGYVTLSYGMGDYSIRRVRWNEDMSGLVNKLQYFLGPRVGTPEDPAGDQHWRANVTGQNQAFNPVDTNPTGAWGSGNAYVNLDTVTQGGVTFVCHLAHTSSAANQPGDVGGDWPKYWYVWKVPPGGRSVDASNTPVGPPWTDNPLGECIYNSRITYGVRMEVQIFDGAGSDENPAAAADLYQKLWQAESWLRQNPRQLIHVTPIRGYPLGSFDIGDIITVEAVSTVRGGFSGAQRIYQFTVSWDEDGPCEISELQTSSDVGVETGV